MVTLSVLLFGIVQLPMALHASVCSSHIACGQCTTVPSCVWVPDRYSCVTNVSSVLITQNLKFVRSCEGQPTISQYPPNSDFVHSCYNGGVLSDFTRLDIVTGASCDCPAEFTGSKCDICKSSASCGAGYVCSKTLHNIEPEGIRELSCVCDSAFCNTIYFGPGQGVVNVQFRNSGTSKLLDDYGAVVDILQSVPRPDDTFYSPSLIRARLTDCDAGRDMPCSQVCGNNKCEPGTVWNDEEYCRVWECSNKNVDLAHATECAPVGSKWAPHADECATVMNFMKAPYQFVCVVNWESDDIMGVNGVIKCGFSTKLLSHPSISLACQIGTCVTDDKKQPSDSGKGSDNGTSSSIFFCSGRYGDQQCWSLMYFFIMLIPCLLTGLLMGWVTLHDREQRSEIAKTVVSSTNTTSMIGTGNDDVEARPLILDNTHRSEPRRGGEDGEEEDDFVQRRQQRFIASPAVTPSPILSFNGLSFSMQPQKTKRFTSETNSFRTVLHSVSGFVKPGEIMAIMGPSGSGKTSLIDILAGRKNTGRINGSIALDGRIIRDAKELRARIGYVTQDDILPSTSTVTECLMFSCRLRGNQNRSLAFCCERVETVMQELKLTNCRKSLIGGGEDKSLSGGEKRRVSIACELLSDTSQILILDEPTSGLDSNSTQSVVDALTAIVENEQKSVLLSIHQPSSKLFWSFDRVIILSQTGRQLYSGPTKKLEAFFGAFPSGCNPAEHLIDLSVGLDDDTHRQQEEKFEISQIRSDEMAELRSLTEVLASSSQVDLYAITTPKFRRQIIELFARSLRHTWRHPSLALTNVVATLCVGVCCGVLYRGVTNDLQGAINRAGLFFFFLCFLMLASLADLGVFQEERLMYMRERAAGSYSPFAFLLAKIFGEILPLRIVPMCITCFILTFVVGLNPHPQALLFMYLILLFVSLCSTLQFLCLGMMFPTRGLSNFAAVLLTMFQLLMSGFLLQFDGTGGGNNHSSGFAWMQTLSVLHFGFEALMVNEIHGVDFKLVVKSTDGTEITRVSVSGDLIMAQLGLIYDNFYHDVGMVLLFCLVFSVLGWMFLEFLVIERR